MLSGLINCNLNWFNSTEGLTEKFAQVRQLIRLFFGKLNSDVMKIHINKYRNKLSHTLATIIHHHWSWWWWRDFFLHPLPSAYFSLLVALHHFRFTNKMKEMVRRDGEGKKHGKWEGIEAKCRDDRLSNAVYCKVLALFMYKSHASKI